MSLSVEQLAEQFSRLFPQDSPPPPASTAVGGEPVPSSPALGCGQIADYRLRGYHFDANIRPDQVVAVVTWLDQQGFALDAVTGVDWLAADQMEVVYDFFHPSVSLRVVVRTRIPRDRPEVPTISPVYAGANWHERETHEFFGIRFLGHPNLTPLLLPEDADYHPLRKDFAA